MVIVELHKGFFFFCDLGQNTKLKHVAHDCMTQCSSKALLEITAVLFHFGIQLRNFSAIYSLKSE